MPCPLSLILWQRHSIYLSTKSETLVDSDTVSLFWMSFNNSNIILKGKSREDPSRIQNKPAIFFTTGYESSSAIKEMRAEDYWVGTAEPRPMHALKLNVKIILLCPLSLHNSSIQLKFTEFSSCSHFTRICKERSLLLRILCCLWSLICKKDCYHCRFLLCHFPAVCCLSMLLMSQRLGRQKEGKEQTTANRVFLQCLSGK